MARFRRTFRRKPVRRVYRRRRRVNFRLRRSLRSRQILHRFKFTRSILLTVPLNKDSTQAVSFIPTDFNEFLGLYQNFEAYRFTRIRVRVIPWQSVTLVSQGLPTYLIAPWHRDLPSSMTFADSVSLDKAKIYRDTQRGHMSFKPNTLSAVKYTGGTGGSVLTECNWAPRIENIDTTFPRMYGGVIVFSSNANPQETTSCNYTIIIDAWCRMYNQKSTAIV